MLLGHKDCFSPLAGKPLLWVEAQSGVPSCELQRSCSMMKLPAPKCAALRCLASPTGMHFRACPESAIHASGGAHHATCGLT